MESLVPLFRLVGPMHQGTDKNWDFSEPIQHAGWSRYAVYAPRIKSIRLGEVFYGKRVSNQAFRTIVDHIPPHLELPRPWHIFTLTSSTMAETPQEVSMISQSLRNLLVGPSQVFRDQSQSVLDSSFYIRTIVEAAAMLPEPSLETLNVGCYDRNAALLEAFTTCLTKHSSRLSRLTATFPFNDQVWAVISSLPNLRALDIAPLDIRAPALPEETLPKIRTLLEHHLLLRTLHLELPFPPEESLYPRFIRNLMGLRGLQTLILHVTSPLFLFEAEVQDMGASWPRMRKLQLSTSGSWSGKVGYNIAPRTDLSLLPSFLSHIPYLKELCIPLACKQSVATPLPSQVPVSTLELLDLDNSPTLEASREAVVAYLAAVLPRGAHVRDWNLGLIQTFWAKVGSDLASM
ncbi:hypothetical protein FS837_001735 [Tulasnella sp. UAMH 9824]|nr:hypothetical protein FS837_001735 [Tulasnella sp. UAMH 9824]